MKVLVIQSCLTLCDTTDCSLPGSSVHGILQAKILEWAAIPFSRGSSQPRDQTQVSCTAGRFFTIWATRETEKECCLPIRELNPSPTWLVVILTTMYTHIHTNTHISRRQWQPSPIFLPGKSHGKRSLVGYSPQCHRRVGHNLATKQQQLFTNIYSFPGDASSKEPV